MNKIKTAIRSKLGILLLLAAAVAAIILFQTNRTAVKPKTTPQPTPAVAAPSLAATPIGTAATGSGAAPKNTPAAQGTSLPVPTGSLLSSAKISLNGTEESTCVTAHGVVCYLVIKSSSGAELGRLLIPEVDGNGGHLLDWPINKSITTAGKYKVSALAVNGDKTATSGSYDLEVTQ